jgi:hypothetical protein
MADEQRRGPKMAYNDTVALQSQFATYSDDLVLIHCCHSSFRPGIPSRAIALNFIDILLKLQLWLVGFCTVSSDKSPRRLSH